LEHTSQKLIVSLLMAAILLVPVCVAAAPQGKKSAQEKEWNLLMFWDADNNLEFCTEFAMQTWEAALTSSKHVNIVAYIDIISVDGVWIYDIVDGKRRMVAQWPEMDSSDPATLEHFLEFALKSYPAEKNMLVLQDHGFGWRGVCNDETNRDTLMTIDGVAGAIRDAEKATRRSIDLLAMDACNMATIEVAYELRDVVPYYVASETMVPFDGLPYMMFISDLMADPELDPVQLAESIVYEYVEYYSSKWDYDHIYTYSQDFATMAAIDLSKMAALGDAFQELATTLRPLIDEHRDEIERARGYALIGQWANMAGYEWMPDVYTFVEGLRAIEGHPELTAAVDAFLSAHDDAVLAQANSKKYQDTVHGMNFWFPPSLAQYDMMGWTWARQFVYEDIGLDLVQGESPWYLCLMTYYGVI